MVSAPRNGTVLFVGLKGLQGSSYSLPVRSISTTLTIKVRLAGLKSALQTPELLSAGESTDVCANQCTAARFAIPSFTLLIENNV